MFKSLINWLKKPYYFNPSIKFKFKTSLIFGFFVFVFLYAFQPFTLSSFQEYLFIYTLSIGFVTFLGNFFFLTIPPKIFKDFFHEDHWTIGKNIIFIFFGIIAIGSILWYLSFYFKKDTELIHIEYYMFLYYTFLVGAFPIFLGVYINEKTLRERREHRAREITSKKSRHITATTIVKEEKPIIIHSNNQKDHIKFYVKDLVYINSQGNYTSFFILNKSKELKEKILRISLNSSFEHLKDYEQIIKCHKSYIVNLDHIHQFSGNARGYLLHSVYMEHLIPVSRSFNKGFITELLTKN